MVKISRSCRVSGYTYPSSSKLTWLNGKSPFSIRFLHLQSKGSLCSYVSLPECNPYHPCMVYLHLVDFYGINVGIYTIHSWEAKGPPQCHPPQKIRP